MTHLPQIHSVLHRRLGLNDSSLAPAFLENAVRQRLRALRLTDATAYWEQLRESEAEWSALIEEIIVPETWFFRDQKPFEFLAEHVRRHWLLASAGARLRILSAPCSSGEEPYSIAITLLEGGLKPERFTIDAVDISERLLVLARKCIYRPSAFRNDASSCPSGYVERLPTGEFRLAATVSACVHFHRANLLDVRPGWNGSPYHLVFCRNLMIYLDEPSRRRVVDNLSQFLVPGGLLFVGHAEANSIPRTAFEPCPVPGAFCFRRLPTGADRAGAARSDAAPAEALRNRLLPVKAGKPMALAPAPAAAAADAAPDLEPAEDLANLGRLDEAVAACHRRLERRPDCLDTLFLLAVIRTAQGKSGEAEDLFAKVLYLDPNHAEAMLHLVTLADRRGDTAAAGRYRQRFERVRTMLPAP